MYLENELKKFLNIMQDYLTNDSEKILLIFDKRYQLEGYRKGKKEEKLENEILITYGELLYNGSNCLTGRRFRRYWFMTDEDLLDKVD